MRTAAPSIEPSTMAVPTTSVVSTTPRRSTRRRSRAVEARSPSLRQASRASQPSSENIGAPASSSGLQATR
ncbi:hypothetical protein ACFQZC_17350 [Streptacidiphilus monticola]